MGNTYYVCGDTCPTDPALTCTRPVGHVGRHEAKGWPTARPLARWGGGRKAEFSRSLVRGVATSPGRADT